MTKFFKKPQKPYFGAILGPFCANLGENEFSWKKELCQFLNILIIYHRSKNQKKIMSHSWEKCRTDGGIDTDGQTDNGDFIGRPSVGRGSKNTQVHSFLLGPTHANLIFPSKTLNSSLPFTEKILWNAFHVKHK